MHEHHQEFVDRIWTTLNPHGRGWTEHSAAVLLVHICEASKEMYSGEFSACMVYGLLVQYAMRNPDSDLADQLARQVSGSNTVVYSIAYYQNREEDRDKFYAVARHTKKIVEKLSRAPIS